MAERKRVLVALTAQDFTQTELLKGMRAYLLARPNLHAHFCMLDPYAGADVRLMQKMLARFRPDGVLARVFWKPSELRLDAGVPLVNIGDALPPAYPTVMIDQTQAGRIVAEHLLAQDIPHYAFAAPPGRNYYYARLRWQGFRARLRRAGHASHRLEDHVALRRGGSLADDELCAWLAQLPRPVGIHAVHMGLAVRVLWACQELELRVPEEVALVGGQDINVLATAWDPSLSAIDLDFPRVGYEGMRLLDRLMHGEPPPTAPLLLAPVGVVPRQSSDVRGMRDQEVARLRQLIRERAHQALAVKEVLAHTPLSRDALERRFEKHLGHSMHDEIVLTRMERAQQLLRETLQPATQVAAQCGYASYAVFSVAFRKHTGMSALDYRRRGL